MDETARQLRIHEFEFRLILGRTKINYDPEKEELNRKKHGYSLESGLQQLERIIFRVGSPPPCLTSDAFLEGGEVRHQHMGVDDSGRIVFMVTTMRGDETVRVISFRRANFKERELFRSITGFQEHGSQFG